MRLLPGKTIPGAEGDTRLTHLLRPNVTRPDFTALGAVDTPPASDIDAFSVGVDTEDSDMASELVLGSEQGDLASSLASSSFLPEGSHDVSHTRSLEIPSFDVPESSVGGRGDVTLSYSLESLTLEENQDWDSTPRRRGTRASPLSSRSPSRSVHRTIQRVQPVRLLAENRLRFWLYVFA